MNPTLTFGELPDALGGPGRQGWLEWLWLMVGSALLVFVTWHWNAPLAAWLAPVFLMRYVRRQRHGYLALLALPAMAAASFANKRAAWGFDLDVEILTSTLGILPLFAALIVDRFAHRGLPAFPGTLVFPAVYVALDFALATFLPLGSVFSLAPTQFALTSVIQLAAIAGLWGIEFVVTWLAPVANLLWDRKANPGAWLVPVEVYAATVGLVLLGGELRLALAPASAPTVRVAGVTVAHPRNYWDEIVDRGTPRDRTRALGPELASLEDALFARSEQAVAAGAKVVFWSEGDAVLLPEHRDAFVERARAFARSHQVYLVPAYLVFAYGETAGDNGLLMIRPDGEVAYTYTKTKSWYATDSDGILRAVTTPYGRIATAICFDMDFPGFARQAAALDADIMLVPAFDTLGTRPYHTEVGLLRGVEDGFAVVRQVNEGTSMAIDDEGNVLASQDFFATSDRVMLADVPMRGTPTPYGLWGDWFAYLSGLLAIVAVGASRLGRVGEARRNPSALAA